MILEFNFDVLNGCLVEYSQHRLFSVVSNSSFRWEMRGVDGLWSLGLGD